MKKLIYPLFALAALAMTNTSCQDELENGTSADSNEVAVSFKVQLENAVGSRALIGDGTNAKYLAFAVYKEAVNDTIDNEVEALRQDNIEVDSETLTATVTTRLVKGQTYNFIFWAQNEKTNTGTAEAPVYKGTYYDVTDLRKIQVVYTDADASEDKEDLQITANEEKRDAFYAVEKALKITGPINETITLKRPFAQVNVGTKIGSLAEAATAETTITKSKMVIKGVATMLYPYSGRVSHAKDVTYTSANIPESNHTDAAGDLKDVTIDNVTSDYEYLSMNYMLVDDQNMDGTKPADGSRQGIVSADLTLYAGTEAINTFEIPNIPVQRNWRTNIIGDILSETVTFNIVIDPKFDNDWNYDTAKKLAYAAVNGGVVILDEDLIIDGEENKEIVIKKNVVLNLNGHTIKATNKDILATIKVDGGKLTINGNGVIRHNGGANNVALAAVNGGSVIINGGTYSVGGDANGEGNSCIEANASTIEINGGEFSSDKAYGGKYWVLNLKDNTGAKIVVKGGKFTNFNPAAGGTENPASNFVATGYTAVNTGTAEAPVYEVIVAPTADANGNMALTDNGVVMNSISLTKGGALDGKGHTLTVADVPATNLLVKGTGDATVKNLTIEGDGKYYDTDKSTRALYFDGALGDVTVSNVHVSGVGYAMNVNTSTKATGALTVSNSTLEGWTSFAGVFTAATFKNVHFGISTYFGANSMFNGGIRPYQSVTLENCTFDQGFYLCLTELGTGAITLKNCKVGDLLITAGNIATETLLKFEGTLTVGTNVIISNN